MSNIVIKAIVKKGGDPKTLAGSLAKNGFARQPGCGMTITPFRESDGRYRTGLDEDALYIREMPEAQRDIEKQKVKNLRTELERLTGLDLGPHSPYYSKMYEDDNGELKAKQIKLSDKDLIFDTVRAEQMLTAAWVMVHPVVAPSLMEYMQNRKPQFGWYVSNEEAETEAAYSAQLEKDKAVEKLKTMTPAQRKRMARILELPVTEDSSEPHVYMQLSKILEKGTFDFGGFKGQQVIRVFNETANLSEESLNIKDMIKQALVFSIYRKNKAGVIMKGTEKIAENENDLIALLASSVEERATLEATIKSKKKMSEK